MSDNDLANGPIEIDSDGETITLTSTDELSDFMTNYADFYGFMDNAQPLELAISHMLQFLPLAGV